MAGEIDRLVPVDQLASGLTEEVQDVEGWHVMTADGTRLGEVARVLADATSPGVRFLEVDLAAELVSEGERGPVLLAVEQTRFFEEGETVLLPNVLGEDVARLPRRYDAGA